MCVCLKKQLIIMGASSYRKGQETITEAGLFKEESKVDEKMVG